MWALPTMKQLNQEAETKLFQDRLKRALKTGTLDRKKLVCEWHDHDTPSRCSGDLHHYLHYDVFSPLAKGILTLCEHHDGYYGSPTEGYFECADCQKIHIENITWERYEHTTEDGDSICIPCYADRVLNDDDRWIPLTEESIAALTFAQVTKAPHCIAVQMPVPEGIEFYANTECDSSTGGRLTSSSSCEGSSDGAVSEIQETLSNAMAEGHTRAILILDGAYQFSISLGLYVPVKGRKYDQPVPVETIEPTAAEGIAYA